MFIILKLVKNICINLTYAFISCHTVKTATWYSPNIHLYGLYDPLRYAYRSTYSWLCGLRMCHFTLAGHKQFIVV